ncbi:MAG: sodium-dependent bicarbonate transport family permease, partial [Rhodospirillales bacterium]|nr:sodium-dependent bicarbonate transport family permease [Rhodospirillales bacterium]
LAAGPLAFGCMMPLIGASLGFMCAELIGLSAGDAVLFMTLSASASYIAVPAAMRIAMPDIAPALYVALPLGVTFPFNLLIGIPLYVAAATYLL